MKKEVAAQMHLLAELGPSVSVQNHKDNLLYPKAVDEVEEVMK